MVQYKSYPSDMWSKKWENKNEIHTRNSYWKLGLDHNTVQNTKDLLRRHKYRGCSSVNKTNAEYYVGRCQRGLLSYKRCRLEELRTFCISRGVIPTAAWKKPDFVAALDQADKDATFDRFLRLPPELRNKIYELHFQSFDALPIVHHQPPITLASRQLRSEAIPLFYSSCTLRVCLDEDLPLPFKTIYSFLTERFLKGVNPENFSHVRHLDIELPDAYACYGIDHILLDFTPGLPSDRAIRFNRSRPLSWWQKRLNEIAQDYIEISLFSKIQDIMRRAPTVRLRVRDTAAFPDAIDQCLRRALQDERRV